MASPGVLNKFRGCLLGGLIGDCFGSPFEDDYFVHGRDFIPKTVLSDFLADKLAFDKNKQGAKILEYTDDTEMAISIAESLLVKKGFDAEDMAQRFGYRYSLKRKQGEYGNFIRFVLVTFHEKKYKDVFDPAKGQFDGAGSLGNGGAMRTHPVALFCHNKSQETFLEISRKTALLTHAHVDGYNGAILQALAIRLALEADSEKDFDQTSFLACLEKTMASLESERPVHPKFPSYCAQIEKMRSFLQEPNTDPTEVAKELGNEITAPRSVPSAIYCFLRAQKPLADYETDNPFLRTLYLSIVLGGDTDTIACMACSIAGAFYGASSIPECLYEQCEAFSDILEQANELAELVGPC